MATLSRCRRSAVVVKQRPDDTRLRKFVWTTFSAQGRTPINNTAADATLAGGNSCKPIAPRARTVLDGVQQPAPGGSLYGAGGLALQQRREPGRPGHQQTGQPTSGRVTHRMAWCWLRYQPDSALTRWFNGVIPSRSANTPVTTEPSARPSRLKAKGAFPWRRPLTTTARCVPGRYPRSSRALTH
ncbi:hypothetical protein AWB79_02645 [Caballeronia hypogeia]|uniref:Uncharacterized protein n=1 Tax=Caballeronia hypogeia TaxID=1777140 RepID=A0A158AP25_9BURK|nr:hypothetical protein AWB79_02645 [Caballeronia hypogeia]